MSKYLCPCHGAEYRDARFSELDALIAAGWGNVPNQMIDRIKRKNGGALPERVPGMHRECKEQRQQTMAAVMERRRAEQA